MNEATRLAEEDVTELSSVTPIMPRDNQHNRTQSSILDESAPIHLQQHNAALYTE